MDILVRRKRATAADVLADLPDQPSYSAVRSMLRLLEDKGYVRRVGRPATYFCRRQTRRISNAPRFVTSWKRSSTIPQNRLSSLLGANETSLTADQLDRLAKLIAKAKKNGGRL
jgi:predicted transcriptional regulator